MNRQQFATQERRRRTHRTLIGVILATLPCYFCGIVLLLTFSGRQDETTNLALTQTFQALTQTVVETLTETSTITPTYTPGGPTLTIALPFTPTQYFPATNTPRPTNTPAEEVTPDTDATATIEALLTQAAEDLTAAARPTRTPTSTPTKTPTSTLTNTPTNTPTRTPTTEPTEEPTQEPTEEPTEEPPTEEP
jgi:hypothetical protein